MKRSTILLILIICTVTPAQAGSKALARRPVILTTDCGAEMDDQWTVAHLALAPEIELRGIVTTHAPSIPAPAAVNAARTAREVLDHMPLKTHPVIFAGSSVPLPTRTEPLMNDGVRFLLRQSRGFSPRRRLAVLIIGAATDVASALLSDPTFGDRIEIIAMGFEKWPAGGDSWNVKNDVNAWQVILSSRASITVGDAAVTLRELKVSRQFARSLFGGRGVTGRYLVDVHAAWLDNNGEFCEKITGDRDTWPIWDEVAVAYLLGLTQSKTYRRPAMRPDMSFTHSSTNFSGQKISWITQIDADRLWRHFTVSLDRAGKPAKY